MLWPATHLATLLALTASASPSAPAPEAASAEQLYTLAEREEHDLEFSEALEHYDAAVALEPSMRYALRARARASWLRRHSEGGFAPLARLERVRRDAHAQYDAVAMDSLAHDIETFPPGTVRCEARMLVAEAYASRLARPADAERELSSLLGEPARCDGPLRAQAATKLVDLTLARDDIDSARQAAAQTPKEAPELTARVGRLGRRRVLRRGAVALVSLSAALGVWGIGKSLRDGKGPALARFAWRALVVSAYLAAAGGILAAAFERGHALPFVSLAASTLVIAILARASALAGSSSRAARTARAVLGGATVFAAALLVLERIDTRYLESFGL